jgi:hypothetical protein
MPVIRFSCGSLKRALFHFLFASAAVVERAE